MNVVIHMVNGSFRTFDGVQEWKRAEDAIMLLMKGRHIFIPIAQIMVMDVLMEKKDHG